MTRVIRKYPNRRLYDTEDSRYVTLADIRSLVLREVPFVVVDKKSGRDISRATLLQVISEQEQNGESVMTEAFLAQVIRACGNGVAGANGEHLEASLTALTAAPRMS